MANDVAKKIFQLIKERRAIHMTLLDPQKTCPEICAEIAKEASKGGTSAIMVGGSTLASNSDLDHAVKEIKQNVDIPVILFPNNVSGIRPPKENEAEYQLYCARWNRAFHTKMQALAMEKGLIQ